MISIQTNVSALYGLQNLQMNQMKQQSTIEQMTSGFRINTAADDPAGLAQANQLRNQNAELMQGVQNGNNAIGQLQIIDGGLSNISQILDRLKTLATEGASSTFTGDYQTLANEFAKDVDEITRQASNVGVNTGGNFATTLSVYIGGGIGNVNGNQIGQSGESVAPGYASSQAAQASFAAYTDSFGNAQAAGASVAANASPTALFNGVDAQGLGLGGYASSEVNMGVSNPNGLGLSNAADFQTAIGKIAAAVSTLGKVQGTVGAGINQLNFSVSLAQSQITNYSAAQSGLRDANMAQLATQASQSQVLMQSSMAALAQANQSAQSVLKLLQ
jgi:flagellin